MNKIISKSFVDKIIYTENTINDLKKAVKALNDIGIDIYGKIDVSTKRFLKPLK